MKKTARRKPVKITTASGFALLPTHVAIYIGPDLKRPGLFCLDYSETLPTRDRALIARTVAFCEKVGGVAPTITPSPEGGTYLTIQETGLTHEQVGARMASEFLCWSPLGRRSLMEIALILAEKTSAPRPVALPRDGKLSDYVYSDRARGGRCARAKRARRS